MVAQWLIVFLFGAISAMHIASAADLSKWDPSYDPVKKTRFIPIELWTGSEWDGVRELKMTPANLFFGGGSKRIVGPILWTRPGTGDQLQVYERINRGKKQLFALSSRKDGLGRVFDNRYDRDCIDEVKFPLGQWRDGETRTFDVSCNNGTLLRKIEITIEKLDFNHNGIPHSLQFLSIVDGGTKPNTRNHYTYSPGLGLVSLDED